MDWKDACMEKTLALPNENEICEVGAMIRDAESPEALPPEPPSPVASDLPTGP